MENQTIHLKPRYKTTANCPRSRCGKTMLLNRMEIRPWKNGWYLAEMFFYCKYCGHSQNIKRKLNENRKNFYEKIFDKPGQIGRQ